VRVRAAARRFVGCVKQLRVRATAVRGREAVAATSASAVFVLRAR
jgi:hypothetical protein